MAEQTGQRGTASSRPKDTEAPGLANVLANAWRARILGELYLRPMSVKQLVGETGGAHSTVSRACKQLADWGYIEIVQLRELGPPNGGVERVYAAIRRDDLRLEDWAKMTQSEREEKSDNSIAFYLRRVSEAAEAGTFDADLTRHWSCDAVTLDRLAWDKMSRHLDTILDWLPELQTESAVSLADGRGEGVPVTIGLALFRSPTSVREAGAPQRSGRLLDPAAAGEADLRQGSVAPPNPATVLANPWRARILGELHLRPMSAKQFVEEIGGTYGTILRRLNQLVDWGYVEVVEEREGGDLRGGRERVYAATSRVDLRDKDWARLSQAEREEKSNYAIASYFRRVYEAVEAGTFDADLTRHWSWDAVSLDPVAWNKVTHRLDRTRRWLSELETESAMRLADGEEEAISATVGLALFRSPTSAQRRTAG